MSIQCIEPSANLQLNLGSNRFLTTICLRRSTMSTGELLNLLRSSRTTQNSSVTVKLLDNLLQGNLLGLNVVLPDDENLKDEEDTVNQVVLPANFFQRNWVHILIEPETEVHTEEHEGKALGTKAVRQDLRGVGNQHAAETDVVGNVEEEHEDNDGVGGVVVGHTGGVGHTETGQGNGGRNVARKHADTGCQEELASAEVIDEETDSSCGNHIDCAQNQVDGELRVAVGNANHFQDLA